VQLQVPIIVCGNSPTVHSERGNVDGDMSVERVKSRFSHARCPLLLTGMQ